MKKKVLIIVAIIVVILIAVGIFSNGNDKSTEKVDIKSITLQDYNNNITINSDAWLVKEGYIKADVERDEASFEELPTLIEFVVEDENIAKVNSITFDESTRYSFKNTVKCELVGVNNGETTGYFQTTDGTIKSQTVSITVSGVSNIEVNSDFDVLKNRPLIEAIEKTNELGYTATYTHDSSKQDFTDTINMYYNNDKDELSKWVIVDIGRVNSNEKTVNFTINTKENIEQNQENKTMEEVLSTKLSQTNAWNAINEYGRTLYPYGFNVKEFNGYTVKAKDENTWFIKATAKITNEYNAKTEIEFEAYVSGTNDNPEVIEFNIY